MEFDQKFKLAGLTAIFFLMASISFFSSLQSYPTMETLNKVQGPFTLGYNEDEVFGFKRFSGRIYLCYEWTEKAEGLAQLVAPSDDIVLWADEEQRVWQIQLNGNILISLEESIEGKRESGKGSWLISLVALLIGGFFALRLYFVWKAES